MALEEHFSLLSRFKDGYVREDGVKSCQYAIGFFSFVDIWMDTGPWVSSLLLSGVGGRFETTGQARLLHEDFFFVDRYYKACMQAFDTTHLRLDIWSEGRRPVMMSTPDYLCH